MDLQLQDAELMERWAAGCRVSAGTLLARYRASLLRFFVTKVPDAADDLTQATLLACLESRHLLREMHSFKSYLFGIARHVLHQYYRARGLQLEEVLFNTTSVLDKGPSPIAVVSRTRDELNLMRALATLPIDTRILLELTYWEDLPAAGVADVLGVRENTIYSRLHRAKLRLKLAMEQLEQS